MTSNSPDSRGPILRPKMPELDTIRGLAILGVFLYHSLYAQPNLAKWAQPNRLFLTAAWPGRFGVNLFFVLSGFLITGILVDKQPRQGYFTRFYKRRALRILPAYLALIVVLALTRHVPPSFLVLSLLYLSNVTPLFGIPIAYPVLWSLAVEEHFYLLWPVLCRKFTTTRLMMVCLGIIMASPFCRYLSFLLTTKSGVDFQCNEYTWNSLDGLACGALLALTLRAFQFTRSQLAKNCGAVLVFSLLAWCFAIPLGILTRHTPFGVAFQITFLNFAFTGLLGLFLVVGSGDYARLVQIKFLQFLGYLSYGLYLIHDFFFHIWDSVVAERLHYVQVPNDIGHLLLRMVGVGLLSVVAAYLSRKYFEERFLRLKGN